MKAPNNPGATGKWKASPARLFATRPFYGARHITGRCLRYLPDYFPRNRILYFDKNSS